MSKLIKGDRKCFVTIYGKPVEPIESIIIDVWPLMPPIPSSWKHRKLGTRHVVDRTLGGLVVYIQGRYPAEAWRSYYHSTCTVTEWHAYQAKAKRVT